MKKLMKNGINQFHFFHQNLNEAPNTKYSTEKTNFNFLDLRLRNKRMDQFRETNIYVQEKQQAIVEILILLVTYFLAFRSLVSRPQKAVVALIRLWQSVVSAHSVWPIVHDNE